MGYWGEVGTGVAICFAIIFIMKYFATRYDKNRKATLGFNMIDFEAALKKNNVSEVNRLGARIANNPYLSVNQLRTLMLALDEYKKTMNPKKESLKKAEDAIFTRQFNWGLFTPRYADQKEREEAAKDIINLP